ncbi:MAG: hypothetical protein ACRCUI_08665 [Polymorphobacter sp.]
MHRLILVALIALPACANSKGDWPSLAPRPIEASVADGAAAPAPAAPVSAAVATVLQANVQSSAIDRDFETLQTRWTVQAKTTSAAVAVARGSAPSSIAWSTAQLELTRLGQIGAQIADLRDRLDRVAGDLAVAASTGADTAAALAATGTMITRVTALASQHAATFAASDAALPR